MGVQVIRDVTRRILPREEYPRLVGTYLEPSRFDKLVELGSFVTREFQLAFVTVGVENSVVVDRPALVPLGRA